MEANRYDLVSLWHLDAPIDRVWQVLADAPRWPQWWPLVETVEAVRPGGPDGLHSVWRFTWKTLLPYTLQFQLRVTRIKPPSLLEAEVNGDVAGRGSCRIQRRGSGTTVRFRWRITTCRAWMNWLAPLARPIFLWNHRRVMERGESCLAAWLDRTHPHPPGRSPAAEYFRSPPATP